MYSTINLDYYYYCYYFTIYKVGVEPLSVK